MGAVWLLMRSELRRRWRSLVVVALLVGFAGGVTLAAVAGARRTSTSFDRFRESTRNHDVIVFATDIGRRDVEQLRSLAGVDGIGYLRQLAIVRPGGHFLAVGGPLDGSVFRDVDRLRIVEGRAARPDVPEEVVVPEPLAEASRLRPGDRLPIQSYAPDQFELADPSLPTPKPKGPALQLRVVGISRSPLDLSLQGQAGGVLLLQRSFTEKYGTRIGDFSGPKGGVLLVRLTDGQAGVHRFLDQLRRQLGDRPFDVDPAALSIGGVQDSIDLLAIGILVFGAIAGLAGLFALGIVISRQVALLAVGQSAVRDLGLSRWRRAIAIAGPVLLSIAVGAVIALLGAWAFSPIMPFGVAGRAEPDPGLRFDASALGIGALATAVVLGGVAAIAAWRTARAGWSVDQARRRPSVVTRSLESVGLAPSATIGVRMALEPGRGRTAVPVRSSLIGAAVAVLGVTAVTVFGASLDQLHGSPHDFGVNWDVLVTDQRARPATERQLCGPMQTRLVHDQSIGAIANACSLSITLGGRGVSGVGLTSLRGEILPTVLEGRVPRAVGEVAVGSHTLDALGLRIGDRVKAQTSAGTLHYRIVGRVVVPSIGDPQAVADGAVFTGDGLRRLEARGSVSGSSTLFVRFRPGVDQAAAARRIGRLPGIDGFDGPGVQRPAIPLDVERLAQIDRLPLVLGGFLVILGAVAVGHLLVTSVQRRRRDFAILKSLGFGRGQLYRTVCTQAATVAFVGLLVGLVTGVAAGSVLWRAAAERVGLLSVVDIPLGALAAIGVATLVLAIVVAAFPARTAARTQPAELLRRD
jgi:hypothetical protein